MNQPPDQLSEKLSKELSGRGRERIYRVLVHVSLADGEIHPSERKILQAARRKLGLKKEEIPALEEQAARGEGLQLSSDTNEGKLALSYLAQLIVADGVLHPDEARRLNRISEALGVPQALVAKLLRKAMIKRTQRNA